MADFVDIERQMGETWEIEQIALDMTGAPLRIVDLQFRLASADAALMDLNIASGAVSLVTDGSDGLALIKISPALQQARIPAPALYAYETRGVLADGTLVLLTFGGFNALASLFSEFPYP